MAISAARAAAFDVLLRVVTQDSYAAELLNSEALEALTPADHGLTMQLVMGTLRWQSLLDDEIAQHVGGAKRLAKLDAEVLIALRLAVYQLRYLERIPAHAAVHESVELVKRARKRSAASMVNAVLRKISPTPPRLDQLFVHGVRTGHPSAVEPYSTPEGRLDLRMEEFAALPARTQPALTAQSFAHHYAHPEWLVRRWEEQFGITRTQKICIYDQMQPRISLRLISKTAEQELEDTGIELSGGWLLTSARHVARGDITRTGAYRNGSVAIQDEASQLVALLVGQGSAGERILDCCAAPGGKTSAIAARNPTADVIALDLHPHRARTMHKLVRAPNVRIIAADAQHLPLRGGFHRVLADVPCTGTGTLARNPEIKWRLSRQDIRELSARQYAILLAAMESTLPGGRLVYSTCSLEREENEDVVTRALQAHTDFRLLDCHDELKKLQAQSELAWSDIDSLCSGGFLRTLPGVHPCDGFFAAVYERAA